MSQARWFAPGSFESENHFYTRVHNAQIHTLVRFFLGLSNERIVERYCHLKPRVDRAALTALLRGTDSRVVGLVKDGAPADIVIVQTSEMAALEKAGLVKSVKPLGRVEIAYGVKAGAPRPDISTYPKFRDALLANGAVAYTDPKSGSAGGKLIESVLDKPEFANLKRVVGQARGDAVWLEAAGQLRGAYGVDEVGLLPASLNAYLQFSIAVAANSKNPAEAQAFQNYVLQPQFNKTWTQWGVTR